VRLLEAFERKKGWYWERWLAFMFDGMRPIPGDLLHDCGLAYSHEWSILGGTFSYIRCTRRDTTGEVSFTMRGAAQADRS
jgi:hypothetical protein